MIEKLTYDTRRASWIHNNQSVTVDLDEIIMVRMQEKHVTISCGKNYITHRMYHYSFDGYLLFYYNKNSGDIEWSHAEKTYKVHVDSLCLSSYYPNKNVILIMYDENERKVKVIDLNGKELSFAVAPNGYKMMYFQENSGQIYVVCDGNKDQADQFGRNRMNFRLDIDTGELTLVGLGY